MKSFYRHYHLGIKGTPSVTCFVTETSHGTYYASFALCTAKDQFSKETGRQIATLRYWEDVFIEVEYNDKPMVANIIDALNSELTADGVSKDSVYSFHKQVKEVLSHYYLPQNTMENMEVKEEKQSSFFFDKVLPVISKNKFVRWWLYGI